MCQAMTLLKGSMHAIQVEGTRSTWNGAVSYTFADRSSIVCNPDGCRTAVGSNGVAVAGHKPSISPKERLSQEMRAKVSGLTIGQLCECFMLTNSQSGAEIPTVRGVLMDELQSRDNAAFELWMDTSDTALMDNPGHFFVQ